MFYSPCGLFYNAGLLEEKGWEVPATWDEMWELGDKAKAEGISLFTYPTTGYFDAFFYALMYTAGGPEFFDKATRYEEGIWGHRGGQDLLRHCCQAGRVHRAYHPGQCQRRQLYKEPAACAGQ
jgi:hypothetical protein